MRGGANAGRGDDPHNVTAGIKATLSAIPGVEYMGSVSSDDLAKTSSPDPSYSAAAVSGRVNRAMGPTFTGLGASGN
jgi:hypothetical protein